MIFVIRLHKVHHHSYLVPSMPPESAQSSCELGRGMLVRRRAGSATGAKPAGGDREMKPSSINNQKFDKGDEIR